MAPDVIHTFADPEHFESLDGYPPADDLLRVARSVLPCDWQVVRSGVWFNCIPAQPPQLPTQGWKIHASATQANCERVLAVAGRVCGERGRMFKFAVDRQVLGMMSSKPWGRGGAGKFITIYPLDEDDFRSLLEALYAELKGEVGPYVLSDRRYRDCEVLYYRYGGIIPNSRLTPSGGRTSVLVDPRGGEVADVRAPQFSPPSWVTDPFPPSTAETDEGDGTLAGGRYTVTGALAFSNTGGVYLATTASGEEVVVKEARPHTGSTLSGEDAQTLLQKEFRLLSRLHGTGVAPRAIELFRDWEHLFLVEERVHGLTLQRFNARRNILLQVGMTAAERRRSLRDLERLWMSLAEIVRTLHDHGIVFGDLSPNNVIIDPDTLAVRLIDFEGARELGVDADTGLRTAGFASRSRREAVPSEDRYALGALMLYSLWPVNAVLDLAPEVKRRLVTTIAADTGLSEERTDLVLALLDDDPDARPTPDVVLERLRTSPLQRRRRATAHVSAADMSAVVDGVRRYTLASADLRRTDRLFPGSSEAFQTNGLGVAYGACGVAMSLLRMHGEVPRHVSCWILRHQLSSDRYPPGLHTGLSGIAWVLAEMGHVELAANLMRRVRDHELLFAAPGIANGAAGTGLAFLRLWQQSGEQSFLDDAVRIGERLRADATWVASGCYWKAEEHEQPIGYGLGAAGVATFLLYLHTATGAAEHLDLGRRALDFVLDNATRPDGARHITFRRDLAGGATVVPYLMEGSAGIGTALLRYHLVTGAPELRTALDELMPDVMRKYSVFPGLFIGMSGLANFLLDCHQYLGGDTYLRAAQRALDGVLLHRLDRPKGIAFPGEGLNRISTDYATGSAGIALVVHRLLAARQDGAGAGNFNLLLDDLLADHMRVRRLPAGGMRVVDGGRTAPATVVATAAPALAAAGAGS